MGPHKYFSYHYQIWATKIYYLYKSPNLFFLWEKPQKTDTHLLKPIATQQYFYKISNYLQKLQILFSQLFTKNPNTILAIIYKKPKIKAQYYFGNYLQKAQYYFDNSYKKLNIILTTFTKSPILFCQLLQKAQYYFDNFILASSIYIYNKKINPKLLGK